MRKWISFLALIIISVSLAAEGHETKLYTVGFYSDFEPISYSKVRTEETEGFDEALGYEPDLLRAIEKIPSSAMAFQFKGIKQWDQIWMAPVLYDGIDIGIGGITIEAGRTMDTEGDQVTTFTHPSVKFKQSLLTLAEYQGSLVTHQDLNCTDIVGAVPGTTGEYRFLVQAGIINNLEEGLIREGVSVVIQNRGYKTSNGELSIYDPSLKNRIYLIPGQCTVPLVRYFVGEDEMIPALLEKHITAIARGVIGNTLVADHYPTELFVTAIYSLEGVSEGESCLNENAGFSIRLEDADLLKQLNFYIDFLTDNGKIGYEQWRANPKVFEERAKLLSH